MSLLPAVNCWAIVKRPFGTNRTSHTFVIRPVANASAGRRGFVTRIGRLAALLAFSASLLATSGTAWAQGRVGDVDVVVQPLPNVENPVSGRRPGVTHGYVEYRVRLKNLSNKDRTVELIYPQTDMVAALDGVRASRVVHVLAGQEASVSLFEPSFSTGWGAMTVRVVGVKDPLNVPVGSLRGYAYGSAATLPAVLLSRGIPQDFRERARRLEEEAQKKLKKATPPPGMPSYTPPEESVPERLQFLRSEVPISQWSANWLGYSCYDAIFMTEDEAQQMPAAAQMAVRRYVECGGTFWIHGQKTPDAFSQGGVADGKGGFDVGLGKVASIFHPGEQGWDATYRQLAAAPPPIYHPQQRPPTLYDLLVAETTVPVRGLFLLVVLFSIGIGPVNVWLLSKYRKRIWLWWNVPAISLVTCLAVFGYSLVSEGWTSRGKTASLTLLDERCHRATTIGYVSLYCPLTPSRGLHFGVDTEVALLTRAQPWNRYASIYHSYSEPEGGPWFIDWTNDQHYTSGWVNARVPAYFQIRKNEDCRQRLSIEKKSDGTLAVVNALGAEIRKVYVADASGRVFEAQDIAAGAQRTLSPSPLARASGRGAGGEGGRKPGPGQLIGQSTSPQAELRRLFTSGDWLGSFRGFSSDYSSYCPTTLLAPGGYVAFLDKSPFIESPLADADCQDTVAIVCGISKGALDGR